MAPCLGTSAAIRDDALHMAGDGMHLWEVVAHTGHTGFGIAVQSWLAACGHCCAARLPAAAAAYSAVAEDSREVAGLSLEMYRSKVCVAEVVHSHIGRPFAGRSMKQHDHQDSAVGTSFQQEAVILAAAKRTGSTRHAGVVG